jgi:hypothetical protein
MSDSPTLRAAIKGAQGRAQSALKPKNYEINP